MRTWTHRFAAIVAAGLMTGQAFGGSTITPLAGSLGSPFNNGTLNGWGWNKNYYGAGLPLHYFVYLPYFYFTNTGAVGPNIQVALYGYVLPAPAAIALLGLAGLVSLRRQRPR